MAEPTIIACDPGMYGSLVALHPDKPMAFQVCPLTKHKIVDCLRIGEFVDQHSDNDIVFVVESVHSMPGQGVSSSFKFGYTTGLVTGAVVARAAGNGVLLSQHKVTPQSWKKHFNLIKTKKEDVIELMKKMLPKTDFSGLSKQHLSGIADAYLIGVYAKDCLLD